MNFQFQYTIVQFHIFTFSLVLYQMDVIGILLIVLHHNYQMDVLESIEHTGQNILILASQDISTHDAILLP